MTDTIEKYLRDLNKKGMNIMPPEITIADMLSVYDHVAKLEAALAEIAKGEGAFSRDQLTHASNVIENMKTIANMALSK